MPEKDFYGILGIARNAGTEEIKAAYRRLALQYHPDRNKDNPAATAMMRDLNEAYAVLSDHAKRQEYDGLWAEDGQSASERYKQAHTAEDIFRGSDINQVYAELAKQFRLRNFDKVFREAYGPRYRSFEFQDKGVRGRAYIVYDTPKSAGGPARNKTSSPGQDPDSELARMLRKMATDSSNPRRGKDLKKDITIKPELAAKGGEVELHFKQQGHNRNLKITIPAGIKDGQRIKLKGLGEPGRGGGEPGDMYLVVRFNSSLFKLFSSLFISRR
jgi:DnaJ-class molecular chaperone